MLETTNYKLKKIELADSPPDITAINPNWDKIDTELKSHEEHINHLDADKANKTQEAWITPTLLNGWVNTGVNDEPVGYYKDDFGMVILKGLMKSGSYNVPVFTLPTGYKPNKAMNISTVANGAFGYININANGDIIIPSTSNNNWVSLNNIQFRAV